MSPGTARVENTIPVLPVRNLARSLEFYTQTLGFQLDWGGGPGSIIASVSCDGCPIMLAEGFSNAPPQWVWIGMKDDTLFEEWRKAGAKVRQEPQNWTWAYEMKFEDPDGNVLWLGTESRNEASDG
jgi:predicted lactoylglutathione lyase